MIRLTYFNEVFCCVMTDPATKQRLMRLFSVEEPDFFFSPRYKLGLWDGRRRLFNGYYLHIGLIPFVKRYADKENIEFHDDTNLLVSGTPDKNDEFIQSLNLPFKPYEYQEESFNQCVHFKKLAVFSPTSSGKSLVIYMLARYMQEHKRKFNKVFIIVPTKKLVKQMFDDFAEYSVNDNNWDVSNNCAKISSDYVKDFSKDIIITTYQSICNEDLEFYKNIEGVILDECQGIQSYSDKKAKSLHRIFDALVNARYKFGFTGTPPDEQLYKITILKYFVNRYVATTYKDLLKENRIANFNVNMIELNHLVNKCGQVYRDELNYIYEDKNRNEFLKKLLLKNKGHNQLMLFLEVQKHSLKFYNELINDDRFKDFQIIIIDKDSKPKDEDKVKELIANNNNIILLATYKLLSTGWSVKNLHHIIFAAPLRKKQTVIQSIGRGLRLLANENKVCNIWDIVDKFLYHNVLYDQSTDRYDSYKSENFKINYITINNYKEPVEVKNKKVKTQKRKVNFIEDGDELFK